MGKIDVSIIIPSYNKYPLNLLTLSSLEIQTFDLSRIEVIFIDDASTDETMKIKEEYSPSYEFRYIRCEKNIGRAKARNLGVQVARGTVLLFLDAEMLVAPQFIHAHLRHHEQNPNLIVTGALELQSIYSFILPGFSNEQLHELKQKIGSDDKVKNEYLKFRRQSEDAIQLLSIADIKHDQLKSVSIKRSNMEKEITRKFGSSFTNFELPWLAFLSGNVSLTKASFDEAGWYDERFKGYGWEDRELGYRLHKLGKQFVFEKMAISYHQEHPISKGKFQESMKNLRLFQEIHADIDVLVLSLQYMNTRTKYNEINSILREYKKLCWKYPSEFTTFKSAYEAMLKRATYLLNEGVLVRKLLDQMYEDLDKEIKHLTKLKKYKNLLNSFHKLLKM
ncbi:glycosyltransferase family 2 protein [Bacillus sp. FJAT-45350]|uniref:glycosyltransferase family 2 protein n=1 Tax=Bacillus sp. FJAT-45350 TaxID=2011014 RepID=UPI0015CB51A0|nr:glycosyltransferase [Bacillus sp. FJAT-45350]